MIIKKLLVVLTIVALFVSCESKKETVTSKKFNSKSDPHVDLSLAVEEAQSAGKRILIEVGGDWCKWCHILDDFIKKTPEVKSLLEKNYVYVKVNYSEENKNEKFFMKFPMIQNYPHFFVLDKTGMVLQSQETKELEEGNSYNKQKMLDFLKQWAG